MRSARNLAARPLSARSVNRLVWPLAACFALGIGLSAASAAAQPFTGYELALSGSSTLTAGRTQRLRGVAYRVRGVATLVPFAGPVRARFSSHEGIDGAWAAARASADGTFAIELAVPDDAPTRGARVEVEVGPDDEARRFELPVSVRAPFDVMLRTDRRLYEPGEPVHVWALVRDTRSGRPIVGQALEVTVQGEPVRTIERTITTAESGVAELSFELLESAPEGEVGVTLRVGPSLTRSVAFRVGTRTWERMLATVRVSPEEVAPHASATARVAVTTASGAPTAGATVQVTVDGRESYGGTTGPDGVANVAIRAPAYLVHETGIASVRASIAHAAHGSLEVSGYMRLAVPLALQLELVPRHGALVPEIDDVLYVRVRDGAGDPPPAGTEVIVMGPGLPSGGASARTDDNGLAEIPVRLPIGAAASDGEGTRASFVVRVVGPLERLARIAVDVARAAEVVPTLAQSVLAPGDRVEVALARRPSAAARPIMVELLGRDGELLWSERVASRVSRVTIDLPRDRVGLFSVLARPVREDESLEGVGAFDALIVRPAQPSFVRVEPERPRWTVGETARVRLHTPPGAPRSFAAVLVRDLAAHGGEEPFRRSFLDHAFERAVLDPSGPSAARLARAALAAHAGADVAPPIAGPLVDALGLPSEEQTGEGVSPTRGTLRDPWPLARELARRGIAPFMVQLEEQLEEALASGGLDELTERAGAARRFRDEPIGETLGEGELTPSLLTAVDPSFTYENVARRVARGRLVRLMVRLAHYLDPGEDATPEARMAAREPWARWLPRMVERGVIEAEDLADPWGGRFTLRPTSGAPIFALASSAARLELVSPGPDGRPGTADDVRDPFARVVPAGTPYAVASGEDALMRSLAILSVTERTLAAIAEAYRRTNAEVMEEQIGDAVSARVSEGTIGLGALGTIGHGSGTGSGYGRGAGGLSGRTHRVPSIRVGQARVSGLARVVRERFPPTLLFEGAIDVDPSGVTELAVPLADAVTTYLVETIVWREDGWIWSDDARFEVDRDIVIDAPVPDVAHVGDRLRLPLRVSNRGDQAREVRVSLLPEPALGVAGSPEPAALTIAPGGAAVVPVEVALDRVGDATLSVVVTTPSGEALDAVRRPIRVVTPARRVHVERDTLALGSGVLEIVVPEGADPRRGRVRLGVGLGMFEVPSGEPWMAWGPHGRLSRDADLASARGVELAFALGATRRQRPRDVETALARLSAELDALGEGEADLPRRARTRAMSLIGLAPLARAARSAASDGQPTAAQARSAGAEVGCRHERSDRCDRLGVRALTTRIAREVSADAAAATEDPETWVVSAAGLGWSAPEAHRGRIAELVRRLDRHAVEVGEDRWLPTADAPRSTVLLAMAELSLGSRERAFVLLRTVARWAALGHPLPSDVRALARAAADRLMGGEAPDAVAIEVDGERHEVPLLDGAAELDLPSLAGSGRHMVRVTLGGDAPLWVRVDADYGLPWSVRPPRPGPLRMSLEGEVGALESVSELELVVVNRAPRTIPRPIVEIELPTGAELTEAERARMGIRVRSITRGEGVLTLHLAPQRPGNELRIPLPIRWSVAGTLAGLGMVGYAEDRPDDVTVLAPRDLAIEEAE